MSFYAEEDYLIDEIMVRRWLYLESLNQIQPIKITLHDPDTGFWKKWGPFPSFLYSTTPTFQLEPALDVHRSILSNEIIVESDYPSYEENVKAARFIGEILEKKGFSPLYYYSGNKSIHIHLFFDWDTLREDADKLLMDKVRVEFKERGLQFKKEFIVWLREKIINAWDTKQFKFDSDLINPKHLIRSELSRNKQGFKTFLGYTYKDISPIPLVLNEKNKFPPRIGEIKLSRPSKIINQLIEEFLLDRQETKAKKKKYTQSLAGWFGPRKEIRPEVKMILSDDFKKFNDGFNRGMFILVNELKQVMGEEQAEIIVKDWNIRMGEPIRERDIDYRLKNKTYSLSTEYIRKFLEEIGAL